MLGTAKQYRTWLTIAAGVALILFGVIEVDAVLKQDVIEEALAGAGLAGSILVLILRLL